MEKSKAKIALQQQESRSTVDTHESKEKVRKANIAVKSKVRGLINTEQNKLVQNQAAENIAALQQFYDHAATLISNNPRCQNCNAFIKLKFYRSASAHVLPKRKDYGFPSIACNPENLLILGPHCGCHNLYDSSWEAAATMKIFPLVIEKFKILYPLIDKSERKNIPEVLLQEIEL